MRLSARGVERVVVSGFAGIRYGVIVSERNGGIFEAEIDMEYSFNNYYIYCNGSDTCKIECKQDGCESLCLYCYGTCLVYCDEDENIACPDSSWGNDNYQFWHLYIM